MQRTGSTTACASAVPSATVFIVDDDLSIRRSLLRLLCANGYAVEVFASAREFLDFWDVNVSGTERHPSSNVAACLVLDLCMSVMSGLALQEELAHRNENLPIIFITGHGDAQSSGQAQAKGAVAFLTKPFDQQDLLNAIQTALSRSEDATTGKEITSCVPDRRSI